MERINVVNDSSEKRSGSLFHHLPPTAINVEWMDIEAGLSALVDPLASYDRFRLSMQEYTGFANCFLVSSGRSALTIILLSLKRDSNRSKVIIPAYTCSTVLQSVLGAGLTPVFCDVSTKTLDLDRSQLNQLIDDQVLAIIPTHLYGLAQDISDIIDLSKENDIFVVEDAAQALGARINGNLVGSSGDVGFFSFGRGKCIPSGHGGVIVAHEHITEAISQTIQDIVPQGTGRDIQSLLGYLGYGIATKPFVWWFIARSPLNPADQGMDFSTLPPLEFRNLPPVQAGIGNSILARSEEINKIRRKNAQHLMDLLTGFDFFHFPNIPPQADPVFLRLPFIVNKKNDGSRLFKILKQSGIGISKSYYRTSPELYAGQTGEIQPDYPGAAHLARSLYTLPTHSYLNDKDFIRIMDAFHIIQGNQE
jgi:dTDP-4-amino-4,6-dideoxygalactose transaminase